MKKFTIGLCLTAMLLLGNLNTADARGGRRSSGCSSCSQGQSQGVSQGHYHQGSNVICNGTTCQLTGSVQTIPTGTLPQTPVIISAQPITVTGADGRRYVLVPEAQYRQQQ